jgi:hypothetical protein
MSCGIEITDGDWLRDIPQDVLVHIFSFCDDEMPVVITTVSKAAAKYIMTIFSLADYSHFKLGTYGSWHGYLSIIEWMVGDSVQRIAHEYLR